MAASDDCDALSKSDSDAVASNDLDAVISSRMLQSTTRMQLQTETQTESYSTGAMESETVLGLAMGLATRLQVAPTVWQATGWTRCRTVFQALQ